MQVFDAGDIGGQRSSLATSTHPRAAFTTIEAVDAPLNPLRHRAASLRSSVQTRKQPPDWCWEQAFGCLASDVLCRGQSREASLLFDRFRDGGKHYRADVNSQVSEHKLQNST